MTKKRARIRMQAHFYRIPENYLQITRAISSTLFE